MLAPKLYHAWQPWRLSSTAVVAVAAYLATSRTGQSWFIADYIINFSIGWLLVFAAWFVWMNQIYPKLLSPLRHLPGPTDNSFFNGQVSYFYLLA
jgi:hypothetical protein